MKKYLSHTLFDSLSFISNSFAQGINDIVSSIESLLTGNFKSFQISAPNHSNTWFTAA
jgi:hypothetical protein